jgi:hypothetical protein
MAFLSRTPTARRPSATTIKPSRRAPAGTRRLEMGKTFDATPLTFQNLSTETQPRPKNRPPNQSRRPARKPVLRQNRYGPARRRQRPSRLRDVTKTFPGSAIAHPRGRRRGAGREVRATRDGVKPRVVRSDDVIRRLPGTRPRALPSGSERVESSARPSPRRDAFAPHDNRRCNGSRLAANAARRPQSHGPDIRT